MDVMKNKDTTDPSQLVPTTNAADSSKLDSGVAGIVDVVGEGQKDDEEVDDAEWLRRRQAQAAGKAADTAHPASTTAADTTQVAGPQATTSTPPALTEEQQILSTSRLFVRNLSFLTTPDALRTQFSQFGELEEVHVPLSSTTKQPIGTAFVQYKNPQDAVAAWKQMDGRTYMGRLVHIIPGRPKFGQQQGQGEEGQAVISGRVIGKDTERNVKADIDKKRKDASGKGLNWATLYMNVRSPVFPPCRPFRHERVTYPLILLLCTCVPNRATQWLPRSQHAWESQKPTFSTQIQPYNLHRKTKNSPTSVPPSNWRWRKHQ